MEFKRGKFKSLVHYICEKCENPSELGAVKLNKILYYSDFLNYQFSGKPITNEKYVKQQFGPVPYHILSILDELQRENNIVIRDADFFGKSKKEYIALKNSDINEFTAREISVVDDIINIITKDHTATSISELTHDEIWKLAEIGEELPYCTVFISGLGEITQEDIKWAKEEISKAA